LVHTLLLPAAVRSTLEASGLDHSTLWLAIDTDITLDGSTTDLWLVATRSHFVLVDIAAPAALIVRTLACEEVGGVRTQAGVGSGLLQFRVGHQWLDWLRFSNALAPRFHKVARLVEQALEAKPPVDSDPATPRTDAWPPAALLGQDAAAWDPPHCDKCGLRLSSTTDNCPRCVPKSQILRRVSDLLRPYKRGAVALCLLTVVGVIAELIPPKLQQTMVDQILTVPQSPAGALAPAMTEQVDFKQALLVVVLALAFSRVLLSIVGVCKGRLATHIGTGLTSTLRAQMVDKLQSLAIAYYDRHQVGSMLSRVAHDSEVLHGLMHQFTGGFLLQIVQLLGVGAMLLWINPKLAVFTLIPVPLVFLGSWIFWRKVYPRHYRLWDASSKQMAVLSGMLSGIRVVKAFAQEDREFDRFRSASDHLRDWRLWVESTGANYSAAMQIVFSLGGLIVWYVGGRDVIGGDMTLGQLIAFLAYLAMFYTPLSALSNFTTWLTSFLSGSQRVLELLDTPATIQDPAEPVNWSKPAGAIEFSHVSFGYDRHQPVLKDISFEVAAGEMVGIVGRSGSGKTTMVNLLGRFYDVQEGAIRVDGIDIRYIARHQLRERLGIVFQDSFLFRGTIWKNLSYGQPQAAITQGLEAAKAAGAHDFICRQSLGYETLLGEHGAGLSGGEKQRLSIARTLLYDPRILVLDEATSNIDAEAERSIQQALEVLVRGRTTVAIAHRLSTLRNADRILVFDRGSLAEQGTHAELLATEGIYARLVRMQTQVTKHPSIDRLAAAEEDQQWDSTAASAQVVRQPAASAAGPHWSRGTATSITTASVASTAGSSKQETTSAARPPSRLESSPAVNQALASPGQPAPPQAGPVPENSTSSQNQFLHWLQPGDCTFSRNTEGQLQVWRDASCLCGSAFVVRTFPAAYPEQYLSVRGWNAANEEIEVGIIGDLNNWPIETQTYVRESLARRYLLREINRVNRVQLRHGYLDFEVETVSGPSRFTMRWTQSQAIDYGENGKLMIDSEDNRFVIRNIDQLPERDRERFLQYIYW